jgi:coenzyme F420 hydrogenase subunit beta
MLTGHQNRLCVIRTPDTQKLVNSQRNLLAKRGAIWGRLLAFKLFGLPITRLKGFHLLQNWLQLPLKEKLRSTLGTVRRIVARRFFTPLKYD